MFMSFHSGRCCESSEKRVKWKTSPRVRKLGTISKFVLDGAKLAKALLHLLVQLHTQKANEFVWLEWYVLSVH